MATMGLVYSLGGGVRGSQPPGGLIGGGAGTTGGSGMVGSSARGRNRQILRQAFGNAGYKSKEGTIVYALLNKVHWNGEPGFETWPYERCTPFRVAMNAGDIAGKVNKPVHESALPRPSNQVKPGGSSKLVWRSLVDGVKTDPHGSLYSGNPKYVYDGADYTRYRKLKAINRNYNDRSFGGNDSNAQQSAWRRVHKF